MGGRRIRRMVVGVVATLATLGSGVAGITPVPQAAADTLVSDDCDDGINVNDGTISGTYLKVKLKVPVTGQLWICYRVDRNVDPVIHEGGKLTLGVSSQPAVDSNAGYCATRPNNDTVPPGRTTGSTSTSRPAPTRLRCSCTGSRPPTTWRSWASACE
jgi:hypothetical protein